MLLDEILITILEKGEQNPRRKEKIQISTPNKEKYTKQCHRYSPNY